MGINSTGLHFAFNEEKGFYCLDKPVEQCLSKSKGRTRSSKNEDPTVKYADAFSIFSQFYKNQMNLFKKVLDKTYNIGDRRGGNVSLN